MEDAIAHENNAHLPAERASVRFSRAGADGMEEGLPAQRWLVNEDSYASSAPVRQQYQQVGPVHHAVAVEVCGASAVRRALTPFAEEDEQVIMIDNAVTVEVTGDGRRASLVLCEKAVPCSRIEKRTTGKENWA
jgi:hypothetical protein